MKSTPIKWGKGVTESTKKSSNKMTYSVNHSLISDENFCLNQNSLIFDKF